MSGTFNFCTGSTIVENLPPPPSASINFNGWEFTSKPTVPYQRTFKLMISGLRWYLDSAGSYDTSTSPPSNARVLEQFYETNLTWDKFFWVHPHGFGLLNCRFVKPLALPSAGNGWLPTIEVMLVHADPGY